VRTASQCVLFLLLAGAPVFAFASSGTIDGTNKYAWGNVAGYVNFAPSNSTVTVTDSAITGYAWSENDGWINFQPVQGGVTNDGHGTLGGWAWDESQGWVSFTGVTIDSSGKFTGEATGSNGYAITFDCATYCDVETTWRPASASTQTTTHANGPAVGLYGNTTPTPPPQAPANPALEPSSPPPKHPSTAPTPTAPTAPPTSGAGGSISAGNASEGFYVSTSVTGTSSADIYVPTSIPTKAAPTKKPASASFFSITLNPFALPAVSGFSLLTFLVFLPWFL
jgi:hypothetical protein